MAMFYLKSGKASRDGISGRDSPDNGGGGGSNGGAVVSSSEDAARGGNGGGDEAEESKLKTNFSLRNSIHVNTFCCTHQNLHDAR